jgi:hypothetical protein
VHARFTMSMFQNLAFFGVVFYIYIMIHLSGMCFLVNKFEIMNQFRTVV